LGIRVEKMGANCKKVGEAGFWNFW